jgi:uncharacterized membrane protein YeaQ/YmgE (transglycosylase-associated protein family)
MLALAIIAYVAGPATAAAVSFFCPLVGLIIAFPLGVVGGFIGQTLLTRWSYR